MYDGNGDRVGGVPLIGDPVPPMGRLVLTSEDIEELFDTEPWQGPAMLEVRGESTFAYDVSNAIFEYLSASFCMPGEISRLCGV